jgi:WD40 repeat protein
MLKLGQRVGALKFSPCGSGSNRHPWHVCICDRRGSLTRLMGHTSGVHHLSFSKDGKHLASTRHDKSIRMWPTNCTRVPQQSDKKLQGQLRLAGSLDFSPDDSNLLASADEQEACTCSFNHMNDAIRSLCFLPAREKRRTCIFVTSTESPIRACWDDLSGVTSDVVDMPGLGKVQMSTFSHCGSLLAAACPNSRTITLCNMRTMAVVQRMSIRHHTAARNNVLAFSHDGNTLIFALDRGEIQICQVDDLNMRRRPLGQEHTDAWTVTFDPSSQFLASVGRDQDVQLWTPQS